MNLTLNTSSGTFYNVSEEDARKVFGATESEITEAKKDALSKAMKLAVRTQIDQTAEPLTREGVIADVAATMVVGLASVIKAISEGKDLAGVKAAVQPLMPMADAVLSTLATAQDLKDPEAAIKAGKVVFPYMVKGGSAKVMGDMASLANGITSALIAAKKSA
jgi:hypothetical protein